MASTPYIPIDPNVEKDIIFRMLYYKPNGYYQTAEKLLQIAKNEGYNYNIDDARKFLYKQAVWQIYAPRPKFIQWASFNQIVVPNEVHQSDILYMTFDTINRKTYKYCLCIKDVASKFAYAEPLTDKLSLTVAKTFKKIYDTRSCPLTWPKLLQVDYGSEFKGACKQLMKNHGVKIRRGKTKRGQSIVERFNGLLAIPLYKNQEAADLLLPIHERYRAWVRNLHSVVDTHNNTITRLIGIKPVDAIKMKKIKAKPSVKAKRPIGHNEKRLPLHLNVRYLLDIGELETGRRRITDLNWSPQIFKIACTLVQDEQPVLYWLDGVEVLLFVKNLCLLVK